MDKLSIKKYLAEFGGTFVLVFFGCGTAMFMSRALSGATMFAVAAIALAFGLAIVAMAYSIEKISGCHVNPAVSVAMLLSGKMSVKDFLFYVLAQFLGAIAASAVLYLLAAWSFGLDVYAIIGAGQNGFGIGSMIGLNAYGAFIVEVILTAVFVYVILGVTSDKKYEAVSGLVIGLALTFVHLLGIPLTGTSVNPARSLGPAVFYGGIALEQVWLFIVAPIIGAVIAVLIFKFINCCKKQYTDKDAPDDND